MWLLYDIYTEGITIENKAEIRPIQHCARSSYR